MMSATEPLTDAEAIQLHERVPKDETVMLRVHESTREQLRNLRNTLNSGLENVQLTYDDVLWLMFDLVKLTDPGSGYTIEDLDPEQKTALNVVLEASMVSRGDTREDDNEATGEDHTED